MNDVTALSLITVGAAWVVWLVDRKVLRRTGRHPRSGAVTITANMPRPLLPFSSEDADDAAAERLIAEGLADADAELLQRLLDESAPPPST